MGEVIRRRVGFDGLLLSDDLDMQALEGTVPERAAGAIAAGCDIALNCWARMDDMIGIAASLPALSEQGAARLERAMTSVEGGTGDHAELVAKRDALLALGSPA